jgi:hypothetical protein
VYYVAGSVAGWLLLAGLCYARWQAGGLISAALTGTICTVPTALSLLLSLRSAGKSGVEQLTAVFGGMVLRIGASLGIGVAVFLAVPYFNQPGVEYAYWGSLLIFYLFSLALESTLAARFKPKAPAEPVGDGART